MTTNERGFTLLELMVSTVVMAIISVGIAHFAAMIFGEQERESGETQSTAMAVSAVPILERDIMYGGFGLPAGEAAFQVQAATTPTSVDLIIRGMPVSGPRKTPWTFVLSSSMASTSLQVRCHGRNVAGTMMPDPITDVVYAGEALPVEFFNYVGQTPSGLPTNLAIVDSSSPCDTSGSDYDGDGQADRSMTLTLNQPISVASGTLVVPLHTFASAPTTAVRYFVWNRALWREVGNEAASKVVQDVEAFQVQFGWSATDGTFAPANWASSPPWLADMRQRAVRYQLVMLRGGTGMTVNSVDGIAFDYPVSVTQASLQRPELRRTVYSNNALFAHP